MCEIGALQVSPRHVETACVTPHAFGRLLRRQIAPALSEGHDQLEFVMQILRRGRIRQCAHGPRRHRQHCIRRFAKEERRLPVRVVPHLARMGRVVARNAEDAAYRE